MRDFHPATYGDRIAKIYDQRYAEPPPGALELLASLAGAGPALELGIGTGRIALPLAERGVAVQGIDASAAMVERLKEKAGGAEIPVTIGDFADFRLAERFELIFVVFNTFFALASQEEQVRCFERVAEHLRDGGVFLIEAFVPDLGRFDRGQRVGTFDVGAGELWLEASRHDPVLQRVESQLVRLSDGEIALYPVQLRYAWPAELDLMARLAGLELRDRWGGWDRSAFTGDSKVHVSIYEPARNSRGADRRSA